MALSHSVTRHACRVVATRMQSNRHRQGEPLASPQKGDPVPPQAVGPLAVARDIFSADGITVPYFHI